MRKPIASGDKFNKLTAIKYHGYTESRHQVWIFKCDCGGEKQLIVSKVRTGAIKSCGCLRQEVQSKLKDCKFDRTTHGMTNTKFYKAWTAIKARCHNPNNDKYKFYGARGISVCPEWKFDFEAFKRDMYESFQEHVNIHGSRNTSLERMDFNGDYSKENCRWATLSEQQTNKRTNVMVTFQGKTLHFDAMCREYNKPPSSVRSRLHDGWSLEDALTKPIRPMKPKYKKV